ncbi:Phage P2 baseplate assembly protein gpV [Rhodoblastus acidophilus]|uniref:Phage P2 baseplate assembly protein gpV n=1 Tax=Rhodoblastus acidophilus TaxID=1074 RepID=A0A212S7W5_RHOAC|nr:phage baseplate assembly protein V [Rhodoblastus acidophilus]PPQ37079.1 hypothetical protein CKO16_15935 [Rhodoblastus acidophilus]RAI16672.1 hypothetical protein CH337_20105 [Rhodoblastus acidophilus]SNB81260.1 Phage P2 baseplate assembly protein gpV [Rhodoblastus acidophilus]
MREVHEALSAALDRIAELEKRVERMFRVGKVTDVDPAKQLYRQEIGLDPDGQPVKSPWIRYSQIAGARKSHSPPSKGQQMLMISPDGEFRTALGVPHGWSDENPAPSDKDEDVEVRGDVKITNDGKTYTINGAVHINGDLIVAGGKLTHEGHDVGATHKHSGVEPGGGTTGTPE